MGTRVAVVVLNVVTFQQYSGHWSRVSSLFTDISEWMGYHGAHLNSDELRFWVMFATWKIFVN